MFTSSFSPVDIAERRSLPLRPGSTIRVHQKIVDKGKTRIQVFEGVLIARKHGFEPGATFTVRRVGSDGVAVEKIFPLYSPMIDKVEVMRQAAVRRARLYFLRDKTPKQIREKLRKAHPITSTPYPEQEQVSDEELYQADQSVSAPEETAIQPSEQTSPDDAHSSPEDVASPEQATSETADVPSLDKTPTPSDPETIDTSTKNTTT